MMEWKEVRLGDVCEILDSRRVPLSAMQRAKRQGVYRYYGAQGVIDYVDDYILDGEYLLVAEDGANLTTRNQDIANLVSGKFWVNNHAHILGYNGKCPLNLLGFILNKANISAYVTGCAQPKLNQENLRNIPISLPNNIDFIASILSSLDRKIELNNKINAQLEEMAQAIFKSWFVDFEPFKDGKFVESELGMIPEGWRVGTLGEICDIVGGSTPSKTNANYYTDNGIAWLTPKDLSTTQSKFTSKGEVDITEEGYKSTSTKLMPRGSVLFSSRAPIGYITIAKNEICTNQGFKSAVPKIAGTAFLYCYLKKVTPVVEIKATGSTFKEASGSLMKSLPVAIADQEIFDSFEAKMQAILKQQETLEEQSLYLSQLRDTLLPKLMNGEIELK